MRGQLKTEGGLAGRKVVQKLLQERGRGQPWLPRPSLVDQRSLLPTLA